MTKEEKEHAEMGTKSADDLETLRAQLAERYKTAPKGIHKPTPVKVRYKRSPEGEKAYKEALERKKEDEAVRERLRLQIMGDREAVKTRVETEKRQREREWKLQAAQVQAEQDHVVQQDPGDINDDQDYSD